MTRNISEGTKKNLVAILGGSGTINDSSLFQKNDWESLNTGHQITLPDGTRSSGVVWYKRADNDDDVIFIPRHGKDEKERQDPDSTQYGANVLAAYALGARTVVGLSAVGSLRRLYPIGSLVVPDDFVDQTSRRSSLFGNGLVVHTSPRPAFSEGLRRILIDTARQGNYFGRTFMVKNIRSKGTYVVIPGPRFGTKAEGNIRAKYAHIVGMTVCPEVNLAMELGMQYACAAFVVDRDFNAKHEQTLRIMGRLSEPHRVPAYLAALIQHLKEYAQSPSPLTQLQGNIIPCSAETIEVRISNPILRQAARELMETYCK